MTDTSEIVRRLRGPMFHLSLEGHHGVTYSSAPTKDQIEAADRLEALEAECERWRNNADCAEMQVKDLKALLSTTDKDLAEWLDAEKVRLEAENKRLRSALADLISWFPEMPSPPEWRLKSGEYGADDAINAARSALKGDQS